MKITSVFMLIIRDQICPRKICDHDLKKLDVAII
jgi:hypothetical protein